ncbi:GNAT family N-acetyltransferase [Paenibacillus solisilvae]|uniref:GNAT family N-acetyltransferase n=1 Tax=Paenibacillus solisilvae TaxID=2486751 RepID=A0ABW0W6K8_9BACL
MPSQSIIVREAQDSERDAVRQVVLDAYQQYEQTLSPERWDEYKRNIHASIDQAATKARLVAVLDNEIVGSVFLFDSSAVAYGLPDLDIDNPIIRLLAVSQKARGLGVATELIRASAKLALEWGAELLHLHTSDMMASAVKLYERLGFERSFDKDLLNGDIVVKSYKLQLKEAALLQA